MRARVKITKKINLEEEDDSLDRILYQDESKSGVEFIEADDPEMYIYFDVAEVDVFAHTVYKSEKAQFLTITYGGRDYFCYYDYNVHKALARRFGVEIDA